MTKHADMARTAVQWTTLAMAIMYSTAAFAQFKVIEQRGLAYTTVTSQITTGVVTSPDAPPQTASKSASISRQDLSSQNLSAQASVSNDFLVTGQASLRTIATPSVVGLSDDISLSFEQLATTLSQNLSVSGQVTVKSSLTFDVEAPTDVVVSALLPSKPVYTPPASLYSNWSLFALDRGPITGGIDNPPFPPDVLVPVQTQGGLAHLAAGRYVIEINAEYVPESGSNAPTFVLNGNGSTTSGVNTFRTPISLPLTSAAITITAVPEPGTLSLGLLGMLGLVGIARRRRAAFAASM